MHEWLLLHENRGRNKCTTSKPLPAHLAPKAPFSRAARRPGGLLFEPLGSPVVADRSSQSLSWGSLDHSLTSSALGQLTNAWKWVNFLPFGFNLLNRLAGIAVNPRIRNHQTHFMPAPAGMTGIPGYEFNEAVSQTSLGVPDRLDSLWAMVFCSDQDF